MLSWIVLLSSLFVFQTSRATHLPEEGGSETRQSRTAEGRAIISALEEEALRDVDAMKARVLGVHEKGKKEVLGEMDDWLRTAVKNLAQSLDFADREKALYHILEENEKFTNEEEEAIFPNDVIKRLAESDPEAATRVALKYTAVRRELREKFLVRLVETLRTNPNPILVKMASAVEKTIKTSLNSYDRALELIKGDETHKPLTRPLCFTCGEHLSIDPDYDFFSAMMDAASNALAEVGLQDKGNPSYDRFSHIARLADGRMMAVVNDAEGKGVVQMKSGNWTYVTDPAVMEVVEKQVRADIAKNGGKYPQDYSAGERNSYNGMITDFNKLRVDKNALAAASAKALPTRKVDVSRHETEVVKEFVRSQAGNAPDPAVYGRPELIARDLGLIGPDRTSKGNGEIVSYLDYVGAGQQIHPHYNIKVRWDVLKAATPQEQERVIKIFEDIAKAENPTAFKVISGDKNGHCVWCYWVNNQSEWGPEVARLRANIGKSLK